MYVSIVEGALNMFSLICSHMYWDVLHPDNLFLLNLARCHLTVSVNVVMVFATKVRTFVAALQ